MFRNQNFATSINGPNSGPFSAKFCDTGTAPTRGNSHYKNEKASFVKADILWRSGHKVEALQEFQAVFDGTFQKHIPQYVCKLLYEDDLKSCNFSDLIFWCSSAAYAGISNDLIVKILIKHIGGQLQNISEDLDGYRKFLHNNLTALKKDLNNLRRDVEFMTQKRKSRKKFAQREPKKRNEAVSEVSFTNDLRNFYNTHLSVANNLCNDIVWNTLMRNLEYYNFKLGVESELTDNVIKYKCKTLKLTEALCKAKSIRKKRKLKFCLRLKKVFGCRQVDIFELELVSFKKISTNLYKRIIFVKDNAASSLKSILPHDESTIHKSNTHHQNKSDIKVAIDNFCNNNEIILKRLSSRSYIDKTIQFKKSLEEFCKDHDIVLKRLTDISTEFTEQGLPSGDTISKQSTENMSPTLDNTISALDMRSDVKDDSISHENITALTDITNRFNTTDGLNRLTSYHKIEIKPSIKNTTTNDIVIFNENTTNRICSDEIDSFTSLEMFCNDSGESTEFFASQTSNYVKVGREIDCMELLIERACMFDTANNFALTKGLDILDPIFDTTALDEGISDSLFYEYYEGESSDYQEYSSSSQEETLSSFKNCSSVMTIGSCNEVDKGYSSEDTVCSGTGYRIDENSVTTTKSKDSSLSSFSLINDNNIWFNYVVSIAKKYNIKNYLLQYSKHKNDVSVKFNINLGSNFKDFAKIIMNCNLGEDFFHAMLALYPVELTHCDRCDTMSADSTSKFSNWNEDLSVTSRSLDSLSCIRDIISRWPIFQSRLLEMLCEW